MADELIGNYGLDSIRQNDGLDFIRRNRVMFLGREEVYPDYLLSAIASDAFVLGVNHVELLRCGRWWLMSSSEDWLTLDKDYTIEEPFINGSRCLGGRLNRFVAKYF